MLQIPIDCLNAEKQKVGKRVGRANQALSIPALVSTKPLVEQITKYQSVRFILKWIVLKGLRLLQWSE